MSSLPLPPMSLDAFLEYLCQHEHVFVGYGGFSFCQSPLSCWLSERVGRLVMVYDLYYQFVDYGPMCMVPRWARLLSGRLETYQRVPLTGEQVLTVLADLERSEHHHSCFV